MLVASSANADRKLAIIGDNGTTALSDLLTASLSRLEGVTLVEREKLNLVLDEQQLNAALHTENVTERVRLGKLFKADLLLILRAGHGKPSPAVRFAVAEIQFGLRLYVDSLETPDLARQAEHIHGKVASSVARLTAPITHILAVPPFLNNSFTVIVQSIVDCRRRLDVHSHERARYASRSVFPLARYSRRKGRCSRQPRAS
jgi:hypothetical protein